MLYNLHLLRVIAALAVVFFHTTNEAGLDLPLRVGSRGVDIFFVISGFIISHIERQSPRAFLSRRLIRVCPFYWAATLVVFVLASVLPQYFRSTEVGVTHLIASLLFIPHDAGSGVFPTMILGWSLNFELFFYGVFTLSLALSRSAAHRVAGALVTAGALVGMSMHGGAGGESPLGVVFATYTSPIVLEFVFGILVFEAFRWITRLAPGRRLLVPSLLVFVLSLAALFFIEYRGGFGLHRAVGAGVPSFFIVLSALCLETEGRLRVENRAVFWAGEASYILYLIHPYVIYPSIRILLGGRQLSGFGTVAVVGTLLTASVGVAVTLHLYFERPLMTYLRRQLLSPAAKEGGIRRGRHG